MMHMNGDRLSWQSWSSASLVTTDLSALRSAG